jgi:hypothetical protein
LADLIVVLFVADRFAILALVAGRLLLGHRLLVGDQLVFIVLVLVLFVVLSGAAGRPALAALLGQLLLAVLDVVERGAEEALLLVLDSRQLVLDSVQLAVELFLLDVQVLEVVLYRLNLSARTLASAL